MIENWKDIQGSNGVYQISDRGRIKNVKTGKMHKPSPNDRGYLRAGIVLNGVPKQIKVHRLVAMHFIPNPNNLPCINHKDENKANNSVENLEWCTWRYNNVYGTRTERSNETKRRHLRAQTLNEQLD